MRRLALVALVAITVALATGCNAVRIIDERDEARAENVLLRDQLAEARRTLDQSVSVDCVATLRESGDCLSVDALLAEREALHAAVTQATQDTQATQAAATVDGPTGIQTIDDLLACVDAISTGGDLARCVPALISLLSLGLF